MRTRSVFLACAFAMGVAAAAAAQTVTGTLQGTVTDTSGGALPGAIVTIKNVDTGATREVTTNNSGFYTAPFLAIGTYTVVAKLNGFTTLVRENVQVGLNQTQVADFQLKPATVAETVTVVGASPPINSLNAEIKGTLNEQQILDKPTLNPGQLPVARRDLSGLPGQSDVRTEQPDGVVRFVDQLQRHGHARRDVPDQRRQQRRLVRESEPPGRGAVDDQGIPGHHQQLQRRVRPRRTAPSCSSRRSPARTSGTATCTSSSRTATNSDGAPQVRADEARQPAAPVRRHRRISDRDEPAVRVCQLRSDETERQTELRASTSSRRRARRAATDSRQRHAGESGVDHVDSGSISDWRHGNDPRSTRTLRDVQGFNRPDEDYSGRARLERSARTP